jgi:hypothetical protein
MSHKPRATNSRRELLRKVAYLTPLIVTLPVLPSFASAGSRSAGGGGGHDDDDGGGGGGQDHDDDDGGRGKRKDKRRGKSRGPGRR